MKKVLSVVCILAFSITAKATYTHWVFEGAGIRGIAYVGALKELDKQQYIDSVQVVGGTSAGSITACFLALGFTPAEMETVLSDLNFRKFNDNRFPFFSGLRNTIKYYGWYEGDAFEHWVRKLIAAKTGNPNSTFRELHENPTYKDLYIMGASINNQRSINFNYHTYPDMQIATAVRISMSIPYYFKAVMIDSTGQRLEEKPMNAFYDVCVDGGITSQLPIELFDVPQENILAFQIVREDQLVYDASQPNTEPSEKIAPYNGMHGLGDYIKATYNLGKEYKQNLKLENYPKVKLVNISDGNVGPRIRKLKNSTVDLLLENGRKGVLFSF